MKLVPGRAEESIYDNATKPILHMSAKSPFKRVCMLRCAVCCRLSMNVRWDFCPCRSSGEWARLQ